MHPPWPDALGELAGSRRSSHRDRDRAHGQKHGRARRGATTVIRLQRARYEAQRQAAADAGAPSGNRREKRV